VNVRSDLSLRSFCLVAAPLVFLSGLGLQVVPQYCGDDVQLTSVRKLQESVIQCVVLLAFSSHLLQVSVEVEISTYS
jgi:hypothetical protein